MVGPYLSQTQQQRLQMVLAPQLRQSLEFLQVPALELRALIQQELEQNPTLEERLPDTDPIELEPPLLEPQDDAVKDFGEEYEMLAQLDDDWQEYFRTATPRAGQHQSEEDERRKHFFDSVSPPESLQEHLRHQLALSGLSPEQQQIGELLIGHIDEDGYLATPLADIAMASGYEPAALETAWQVVRDFDPVGVGARDLRECLLTQIQRAGQGGTPLERVVRDFLDELAAHKYSVIARKGKWSLEQVHELARQVAQLDPKPGRRFSADTATYVTPEVFVYPTRDGYAVALNDEPLPHVRISKQYRTLMESPQTPPEVKQYVMEKIRAGAFLIKSIHQRQRTIGNIATEIVKVQTDFMAEGVKALRPLTMQQVADVVGVHETTVSRAVSGKYMQTPQGVYEMKYFFTPGYRTRDGQVLSNKSVKDRIHDLIKTEDPTAPWSDQALTDKLKAEGINVARRTVAKYREELKIMPSHLRKHR